MWTSTKAENKTASQFVSLTMRLKDKLHPQWIRRTERIKPTQRSKPPDLKLQEHTLQNKSGCVLLDQQRAVVSSLQYFKALVDRLGVDRPGANKLVLDQSVVGALLGGATSGVLETVQTLVQLEPHLHKSKTISTCLTHLYRSLAELIHWADLVILQGVSNDDQESTSSSTTVIRAVLDGVKDLVRLAVERQEGSAPLTPIQLQPTVGQMGGFDQEMLTDRTPASPVEEKNGMRMERGGEDPMVSPPPKPHMPLPQVPFPQGLSPPALPPKRRQSGPTACRVAIVAPFIQQSEDDTQTQEYEDNDCFKKCSSSADSADENTHCDTEADPDYEFLHTDLSSSETLPAFPLPSSLPPALPEKRRCTTAGMTSSQAPPSSEFDFTPNDPPHCDDPDDPVTSPLPHSGTPPPLPEKTRHIHQYLQFCSSYSIQSAAMFYQTPQTLSQNPSIRQQEMETTYQFMHTHLDTQLPPDLDSTPSPEVLPAPALPPKKKQQDHEDSAKDTSKQVNCRDRLQQEQGEEHGLRSRDEQEEVLLTNHQEILHRITMKTEEEEGPDVKAASPEILLVYAIQTDSTEQVLYREAFLSTYRTFISSSDVINKLHHRYRYFCDGHEAAELKAAKNTFHLLVSVVDELCVMELDSDLLLLLTDMVFRLLIGGELELAHLLRSTILSKMEQKWLSGSTLSLRPLAARGIAARPGTLLDFRSQDLAEQLTLMDSELFYKIELPEVLMWSKEQNEEKSPNLTEFTQHFNNVSFWVRSVIILQDKPQDREKLLLKFLKIMKHLRKLNNFNSYLAILSGLDSAPLRRLDWQRNTTEALEEFSSLIDSSSSFRAYRAALAEVEPPCIPYLGLILQDLTFVHLGNPDTLMTSQGSKVNFSKRWQQFNILYTLRSYQQVSYSLQPNDDIILFFNGFSDHLAEEALWELSLRLRPRNAQRINQR
ncbi:rap guanine nucleotide exchange factor 1-like [Solea senegalensis]|uniref:CRK SH3-binding GNRP n=1 Tax=Solea senegalensis TaxID=28829 RepID=A0AAV6QH71_SOLSE|nr:rap guanine nucleotide exchange factor 1-like [Solea senegalensis]KAG7490856.1 rap guanine nucleotide exchange factor 1-like [Solea senegalensis]